MVMAEREPIAEGAQLAAVDLGSNSFHMVVARWHRGRAEIVDRLRETVRLGAGVDGEGRLDGQARLRAMSCLARFGQRLRGFEARHVRALATNAVRQLRAPRAFLLPAETALGFPIEVVSGREEARLIYLGVCRDLPARRERRLVIDIGGGSTEFIIGTGREPEQMESVQMGCIATTRRFFADGQISRKRWREALIELELVLQQFAADFRKAGWTRAIGSSGTIKAAAEMIAARDPRAEGIDREHLEELVDRVLRHDRIEALKLRGLSEERRPVILGGLAVLSAAFSALAIERMEVSQSAMREGILLDLVGRLESRDPRAASIEGLAQRFGIDSAQAERVRRVARTLFESVCAEWSLAEEHGEWLDWAARLHEVGLAIAHSQHHVHGAYLLEHADLPGFSREEQRLLATLVRAHRRSVPVAMLAALPERQAEPARRLLVLLRLAVLFCRNRQDEAMPPFELKAHGDRVRLALPKAWLAGRSLTRADLALEREELAAMGIRLEIVDD
ncbi:MAG: exopolyphosphatase [Lysobacterales bacterium]|jgi:exopolyphosphatase/guanosine-5'-triphosphate,3'-diphosphate pyrophosphatase|nr:MAG: exopolyphosphatase [Xanthomonadales bacterium]